LKTAASRVSLFMMECEHANELIDDAHKAEAALAQRAN